MIATEDLVSIAYTTAFTSLSLALAVYYSFVHFSVGVWQPSD
jgi:NO-binding membrane sensor protein with MHYT domain